MHIILLILKMIGCILLAVLGLVLILLLLLLFAPFRYRVEAVKDPQQAFTAKFRIYWLLHLLQIRGVFDGKEMNISVRLACLSLRGKGSTGKAAGKSDRKKRKRAKQETAMPQKQTQAPDRITEADESKTQAPDHMTEADENKTQASGHMSGADESKTQAPDNKPEASRRKKRRSRQSKETRRAHLLRRWSKRLAAAFRWICALPQKAADLLSQAVLQSANDPLMNGNIGEKIERFIKTVRPYRTLAMKKLYARIYERCRRFLRHYKPRRLEGYIHFGTGRADLTGELTGLLYLCLPANACRYEIDPEFTQKLLDTNTVIRGYIRISHAAAFGIACLLDKDFRRLLRLIRRQREE